MARCYRRTKERMVIKMREIDLVNQIETYLKRYHIRFAKEIRMGIGVPDIALNLGASKSIATLTDYYLLLIIEFIDNKKKVDIREIIEHFSFDKNRLFTYLNTLENKNIITIKGNSVFLKRKIMGLNLGATVSIEAKLKDWKSGILQAERYLMFSDYSYLALPKEKVKNVDMEYLVKTGIGLLAVSSNNIEEVVKPKRSLECDYKQKYLLTSAILNLNSD